MGQSCNNLGIISIKVRAKLSSGTEMKRMEENTWEYKYSSEKLGGEKSGIMLLKKSIGVCGMEH